MRGAVYDLCAYEVEDRPLRVKCSKPAIDASLAGIIEGGRMGAEEVPALLDRAVEAAEQDPTGPELQGQVQRLEPTVAAPAYLAGAVEQQRVDLADLDHLDTGEAQGPRLG